MLLLCTKCSLASTMATIPQNPSRTNHSPQRFIIFCIRKAFKCTKAAWQLRQTLSSPKRILILALYIWWKYISENQRTCQRKAHPSSSVELLAPQRGTCENWAIALQGQGDFAEHVRKSLPKLARNPREGNESDYVQLSKHSAETPKSVIWCSLLVFCGKNVYHLCYSLFVMDTNGAFKHKSMGVGNKNTISQRTWKSLLAVYYIRKFWHKMKNGSKPKHEHFQAELRRAAQPWLTLPWRSSSELSDTDKSYRYWAWL